MYYPKTQFCCNIIKMPDDRNQYTAIFTSFEKYNIINIIIERCLNFRAKILVFILYLLFVNSQKYTMLKVRQIC